MVAARHPLSPPAPSRHHSTPFSRLRGGIAKPNLRVRRQTTHVTLKHQCAPGRAQRTGTRVHGVLLIVVGRSVAVSTLKVL